MIRLFWTKSNHPLSYLIRWGLNEPSSHFAIMLDDHFVFHSNLLGVHPTLSAWFLKTNDIVHEAIIEVPAEVEDLVWERIYKRFDTTKSYDFGAFLYFFVSAFLHKFFGIPMPAKNIWSTSQGYLCTELAICLVDIYEVPDNLANNLDMCSPEKLWRYGKPKKLQE